MDPATGHLAMLDTHSIRLAGYAAVIHLNETYCNPSKNICDFLQLPATYTGVWIASRAKVVYYMSSPLWKQPKQPPWKVREMAASGIQFLDTPADETAMQFRGLQGGCSSSSVIPYHVINASLTRSAAIYHSSNTYCSRFGGARKENAFCTALVSNALSA